MVNGMVQTKRYFSSAAVDPLLWSGQTSTLRPCPVRKSKRSTMPPTLPEPEALDQMMLLSTGSGVAQPLSPPATDCQALRGMPPPKPPPPVRLLLGPRYEGPSCLLPYTLYGI